MALLCSDRETTTASISVFVEPINDELTEVRMTIYEGEITSTKGYWGNENTKTESAPKTQNFRSDLQ